MGFTLPTAAWTVEFLVQNPSDIHLFSCLFMFSRLIIQLNADLTSGERGKFRLAYFPFYPAHPSKITFWLVTIITVPPLTITNYFWLGDFSIFNSFVSVCLIVKRFSSCWIKTFISCTMNDNGNGHFETCAFTYRFSNRCNHNNNTVVVHLSAQCRCEFKLFLTTLIFHVHTVAPHSRFKCPPPFFLNWNHNF